MLNGFTEIQTHACKQEAYCWVKRQCQQNYGKEKVWFWPQVCCDIIFTTISTPWNLISDQLICGLKFIQHQHVWKFYHTTAPLTLYFVICGIMCFLEMFLLVSFNGSFPKITPTRQTVPLLPVVWGLHVQNGFKLLHPCNKKSISALS